MKAIVLCAGYATRLYPLTLNKPKALLPVKGKPILNYIVNKICQVGSVDEIFIISNNKFYQNFVDWGHEENFEKPVKIINDHTMSNEDRLGGVGDLWYVIKQEKINDDILVVLGDNLFDFDLNRFADFFEKIKNPVIALVDIGDLKSAKRFGVIEVDKNNKITSFEEKPENPRSTLVSTGIYAYSRRDLKDIQEYMKTNKNKDGPGFLVKDFMHHKKVYAIPLEGRWCDIGSKETYDEVNRTV